MGGHLERARILVQQGRYGDAEGELHRELAQEPESADALTLLALSLEEQERSEEALEHARDAVRLDPEWPHVHYVHARILHDLDRYGPAEDALAEALRMLPGEPAYHALASSLYFSQKQWKRSLRAAERGLRTDPEHVDLLNLRSMALTQLGRRKEAQRGIVVALRADPDSSVTHTNRGWTYLHSGDVGNALTHFSEALRLDPQQETAQAGLVEALKARNPLYRAILSWYLLSSRLDRRTNTAILVGMMVAFRGLREVLRAQGLTWLAVVVGIAYASLSYLSWVAVPLFNLMLLADPLGRHALDEEERRHALWFGASLLGTLLLSGLNLALGTSLLAFLVAVAGLALGVPLAAAADRDPGKGRTFGFALTALLAVVLTFGALIHPLGIPHRVNQPEVIALAVLGLCMTSTWVFAFARE